MQTSPDRILDVSVVMPAYNRSALIVRALDSVRTQQCHPKALIVVDDASTDDTVAQVRAWSERTGFPVRVERMPQNGGPAAARNHGIAMAETSYVAFLDSDDEHLPDTLLKLVSALERHPGAVVAFGDATKIMPDRTIQNAMFRQRVDPAAVAEPSGTDLYRLRDAKSTLLKASIIPTCSACFRRDDALAIGGMPTAYRAGEDWLFWLRLSERGDFLFYLEDLSLVHRHAENLTHPNSAADTSRQKVIGYLSLLDGSAGIALTPAQRAAVVQAANERTAALRYQASRLGLGTYIGMMRAIPGYTIGTLISQTMSDPKSLARALLSSCRPRPTMAPD